MKTKLIAITATGLFSFSASASELVGIEKYTYDSSGNIVEKNIDGAVQQSSFDGGNRLVNAGGKSYQYDQSGRATRISNRDGEKSLSYGYGDRVLQVKVGENSTELYYNAAGHLVGKSNGDTYIWDANALAAEGDEAFTSEAHVVGGVPILKSGEVVVSDHQGNTLLKGQHDYNASAFGEGLEKGMFTGKPYVEELEGFLFKYRNFSASNARWTTPDPIGFPDGTNNYAYLSDPFIGVDPLGTEIVLDVAPPNNRAEYASHTYSASGRDDYADYKTSYAKGTNDTLRLKIYGFYYENSTEGMEDTDDASVRYKIKILQDSNGGLWASPSGSFSKKIALIEGGFRIEKSGEGTRTLGITCHGATALHNSGGGLKGAGITAAGFGGNLYWESPASDSMSAVFGLGSWVFKEY